jgi:hypothetical protein
MKSLHREPIGDNEDEKRNIVNFSNECHSSNMFHLNCVGSDNDDLSSEGHFETLKTKRSSYFLLELFML